MTTVLNSMSTLFLYLWILFNRDGNVPRAAAQLGFKTKYVESDDVGDITFLKGWWRKSATCDKRIWMPLPSACLKLGKLLRNPVDIVTYRHPLTRMRVIPSYAEAVNILSWALASSYGTVTESYPILGAFLGVLRRQGVEFSHPDLHSLQESWKPELAEGSCDLDDCIEAIVRRYAVSERDIERVTSLLLSVEGLPALLIDPVFDQLRARDY